MSSSVAGSEPEYLRGLNPPQRAAVEHFEGPILVLAGAGSGKTRVLTHRVAHLVLHHGVDPRRILSVTFTNKATQEMRARLSRLLGAKAQDLWVATFHAAALRILRVHAKRLGYSSDFVVYDDDDSKGIIKGIVKDLGLEDGNVGVRQFASFIDHAKNNMLTPEKLLEERSELRGEYSAVVYERYQRALVRANAMDFGDLLMNLVLLLEGHPDVLELYRGQFQFILVDEFQDTNPVQYRFLQLVAQPRRNILVVGDDDQSIYAFRGATVKNILKFEEDFSKPQLIKLEQNYRSTATILEASHAVIENNSSRKKKKLWTAGARGDRIVYCRAEDEHEEALFVGHEIEQLKRAGHEYPQIAIFYRTNAQSRAIEEELMRRKIPYRIFGSLRFYERKEIKDILGYLKLIINPADTQSFLRIVNTPPRGIGAQSVRQIVDYATERQMTLFEAARAVAHQSRHIAAFVALLDGLRGLAQTARPAELVREVFTQSEYLPRLKAMKDPVADSRIENLYELAANAASCDEASRPALESLGGFLDRAALVAGNDQENSQSGGGAVGEDAPPNFVSLMTLHLAKGLEFPFVFLTGLEEGLLPHYRALNSPRDVEEERRLCYVGMTRAMLRLYLSQADMRGMFGGGGNPGALYRDGSRFLREIPYELLEPRGVGGRVQGRGMRSIIRRHGTPDFDSLTEPDRGAEIDSKLSDKEPGSLRGLIKTADEIS